MRLGKGKQAISIAILLLLSASVQAQAVKSYKYQFDGNLQKSDVLPANGSITINYSISELNIESIQDENGDFFRISIPDHIPSVKAGLPEVPVLSRLIQVPDGMSFRISISDVVTKRINPSSKKINGLLFPAQEGQTKEQQIKKPDFKIDRVVYATRGIIKDDTVSIELLGTLRNRKLANLYISPVRYNPNSNIIEVITSMKIVVSFIEPEGNTTRSVISENLSQVLFPEKGILNSKSPDLIPGYSDKPVRMIIITDTAYKKHLEPFYRWKTQKGFKLDILYKGAAFAGTSYTQLKESINKIWTASSESNPAPEYLLIIGNVATIPYYGTGQVTDMYYGEFDGNGDYIPEMFVGRLPVADTTELKSVVSKIIQYEKFAFADTNTFYKKAIVTAGNDGGYSTYMNGQVNYAVNNYLTTGNKITNYHFNYPLPGDAIVRDSLKKLINKGVSFINYTGHGASDGWITTNSGSAYYLRSTDVALFENKNMYPLVISNACMTGIFSSPTCFGSRLVLASEKGAIGFIGCSNNSLWVEDYYWAVGLKAISENPVYSATSLGAYDRLFHTHGENPADWYYTLGQINYAGNLAVSGSNSSSKKFYWETYNVIGDPSLIPILGQPDTFSIVLPDTLPNGIKSFSTTIDPFAYVAVSRSGTLWDASYSSPSGTVTLEMPGISNDSCLIVITGQNKIPIIKTIYFGSLSGEYINLNSSAINDIQGDNNGRADFGEKIYLNLEISNLGLTTATNVTANISSISNLISITANTANIGSLAPGSEVILSDDLGFTVHSDVPDNSIVTIKLILSDDKETKEYNIDLRVHAPELQLISCILDDSVLGNDNHIADPGETFSLIFKVSNLGSSDASGQFSISSISSEIYLLEPSIKSGVIKFGEVSEIPITVKLTEDAATGIIITISSLLDCTPFIVNKEFSFRVGRVRESFEGASFNIFPWFNNSTVPWTTSASSAFDGALSARSGAILHNTSTTLMIKTDYPISDSLRFYYKVSSEAGYDYLTFKLNGTELLKKSGEVPWTKKAVLIPAGLNKMEWIYKKDQSVTGGSDCAWLDMVDFSITNSVTYIQKDIQVAKIVSPVIKDKYGQETVTLKVLNTGRDIINGFNLAFKTNDHNLPINEYFSEQLIPFGDTVTVTFKTKADLSKYGLYKFSAYGSNNNDDYVKNDTLKAVFEYVRIPEVVSIFPNPVNDKITIYVNAMINDNLKISLVNLSGTKLYETSYPVTSGKNVITIPSANLSPSTYYVTVKGLTINKTIAILKIR